MVGHTVIIAVDLGTSTTTANHVRVRDSFNNQGKLCREKLGSISDVKDWPGCAEGATGDNCLPTDLIYSKTTRDLLFWGFLGQDYLDDAFHPIPHSDVFVVETIKLLLPDPDEATPSPGSERYRVMRDNLVATLAKDPYEIFEDFLNKVLGHVLGHATRKYSIGLHNHKVELLLAFPSGWKDQIHTNVARIGARALQKAITTLDLRNISFGIENVYTVSETLCGVKEWLRETVAEVSSVDLETQATNLDELNEGDCFLPIDIGGGTGCLTPLKLVSKHPLAVEQLDKTQSLEVSGEAVQAQFESMLRSRITKRDYHGELERAIYQICRRFREAKKKCGASLESGSKTWNCPVAGLKANSRKGFEKDCMRFDRKQLENCFDPVIDLLDRAIEETRRKFPSIKAIVFLGQFGGNSPYLQKRMASNPISAEIKIRHSQSGKLDVVKGAIYERLALEETFVRKFKTLRSYGTLIAIPYNDEVARIFPNPQAYGALPFERVKEGSHLTMWLKVIEWAIPKKTSVENGRAQDIGKDGRRHHTWPFYEDDLGFEDRIIVSEEDVPDPQYDGMSYTLWTKSHENNQLYIGGQRMQVQQIPFCWDLNMSQKLDARGNMIGPYERDELRTVWFPEKKVKKHRRNKLRALHYDLIWEITEMQVKVYVQAHFPNQIGPPLCQLAKEQVFGPGEKTLTGESRSRALDEDIEIMNNEDVRYDEDNDNDEGEFEEERDESPRRVHALSRSQEAIYGHPKQNQQLRGETLSSQEKDHRMTWRQEQRQSTAYQETSNEIQRQIQPLLNSESTGISESSATSQGLLQNNTESVAAGSSSSKSRIDGRRRDGKETQRPHHRKDSLILSGCFTCKERKKKCEGAYRFDETSGTQRCKTCLRMGLPCDMTEPIGARDPVQREIRKRERRRLVKLAKRRSRDASESTEMVSRDRSATMVPFDTWH